MLDQYEQLNDTDTSHLTSHSSPVPQELQDPIETLDITTHETIIEYPSVLSTAEEWHGQYIVDNSKASTSAVVTFLEKVED